ncbi:MAG: acyl-[acyl-carrier-protein]--UDP-N-acetylglucosamine O-acyltransferase [Gemmatimonadales bacterium]|nr:Acyl-[acyl-carrier-protein]--UDP-N-acetylglucosamine O-acyltransferase [bacterium HR33]GIW51073.1 MAG: acyl-[acyl-carrier-protein]--UDP-N-acetylglucosamine O-acyltransferase [Gemmatimonadales bacterium]
MSVTIHPTASIDPTATLGTGVEIGAYVIIGPRVIVGDGTRVQPRATIAQDTVIGKECDVGVGAVLGSEPQDFKYRGEPTRLVVGDRTVIREYATLHRGTGAGGCTSVGRRCYLMAYSHVGHDCVLEDDVVLANAVQLGGHVHLEASVTIGGSSAVHQFVRIGTHAFIGGGSRVVQDVPPYTKAAGNPLKLYGINSLGLARAGFDPARRFCLKRAWRLLFNSKLRLSEAMERVREEYGDLPEVRRLIEFVEQSRRGIPA